LPTIDAATNTLFIGTGDAKGTCSQSSFEYTSVLLALNASNITQVEHYYQIPGGANPNLDDDFGATANYFQQIVNGVKADMVGIANKNGNYYAFGKAALTATPYNGSEVNPIWQYQIAYDSSQGQPNPVAGNGSISPAATDTSLNPMGDGTLGTLYVAGGQTPPSNTNCPQTQNQPAFGSMAEIDLNYTVTPAPPPNPLPAGALLWQTCFDNLGHPLNPQGDGPVVGAVTAIASTAGQSPTHEAVMGEGSWIVVLDTSTVPPTANYTQDPNASGKFYGGVMVTYSQLYIGDAIQTQPGPPPQYVGYLYAFP
jgi:hypothetical protein